MIKMLAKQLLSDKALSDAAAKLSETLKNHPKEDLELMPLMVVSPRDGKLFLDIIVMKMEDGKMIYSRKIDSKELTAEYLISTLSGVAL